MRRIIVVQARTSSVRLPGKVLRPLAGKPLIGHLLDRLALCEQVDGLILATSDRAEDDALAAYAALRGIPCHRGPLADVAGRVLAAADVMHAKAIVRISGDSPVIDPAIVDRVVTLFQTKLPDLATNVALRTFPKGQSVEVLARDVLAEALPDMTEGQREHVTPAFYADPQRYRIANLSSGQDWGRIQLSVDTAEDFVAMEALLAELGPPFARHDLDTVLAAFNAVQPPEIAS